MNNRNILFGVIGIMILLTVSTVIKSNENVKIKSITPLTVVALNNPQEFIGFADHVFVGKIKEHIGNFPPPDPKNGMPVPYNKYKVEVLENIKGKLKNEVEIVKKGGYKEIDGNKVLIRIDSEDMNDYLPEVGKTYIFIASVGDKKFLSIFTSYAHVLLEDFENNGEKTKNLVKTYKDAYKNEKPFNKSRYTSIYAQE